jgi:hypothetical protein
MPVLLVLIFSIEISSGIASAQNSSPVFWELRPEKIASMLLPVPDDNTVRYSHLQEYFSDLHCTAPSMEQQVLPSNHGKNLICVLPGKTAEQILVVSRYEHRESIGGVAGGWNESVMLPLLYNALRAEPRQHTFVFVELYGSVGKSEFLDAMRKKPRPLPRAIVVLDTMGLSDLSFYTVPKIALTAKGRKREEMKKRLESEAVATAQIERITSPLNSTVAQNPLMSAIDDMPGILIYSKSSHSEQPPQAFRNDFEFLAYYLCRIDASLANPPASSSQPPASLSVH